MQYTTHALTIPRAALLKNTGAAVIFVVEDARVHLRPIQVEPGPLGQVKVMQGLQEGELVVSHGLSKLKDNDVVRVETVLSDGKP